MVTVYDPSESFNIGPRFHDANHGKISYSVKNSVQIRSQFCTCHDSWAVMACAKLWPDWIMKIKFKIQNVFTRFHLWAHKAFMEWIRVCKQASQIARFMGSTWGPPGSYRPQMGAMLAPWTLLSGMVSNTGISRYAWTRVKCREFNFHITGTFCENPSM